MIFFTKLQWKADFKPRMQNSFSAAQMYVDSEVLRYSDPYTPFLSGKMKQSGQLGTVIGSGRIKYTAPYARRQYYTNAGRGWQGTSKGGKRGKYWFERMKADHKQDILKGVKTFL